MKKSTRIICELDNDEIKEAISFYMSKIFNLNTDGINNINIIGSDNQPIAAKATHITFNIEQVDL